MVCALDGQNLLLIAVTVKENWEGQPQGWLARDHSQLIANVLFLADRTTDAWFRSHNKIKRFVEQYDAKICFGHDYDVFATFKQNPEFYD